MNKLAYTTFIVAVAMQVISAQANVIFSNGPYSDSIYANVEVRTPNPSGNPTYIAYGMSFTTPTGYFLLDGISLPIYWQSGSTGLSVRLHSDSGSSEPGTSLPDHQIAELVDYSFEWPLFSEHWEVVGTFVQAIEPIYLEGETTYWITVNPREDGIPTSYAWFYPSTNQRTEENGWDANYGEMTPSGNWINSVSAPDHALTVYATIVPEVRSAYLIIFAIATFLLTRNCKKTIKVEQADRPNHHACGTFGTSAAEQPLVPKASGGRSSGTLAKKYLPYAYASQSFVIPSRLCGRRGDYFISGIVIFAALGFLRFTIFMARHICDYQESFLPLSILQSNGHSIIGECSGAMDRQSLSRMWKTILTNCYRNGFIRAISAWIAI